MKRKLIILIPILYCLTSFSSCNKIDNTLSKRNVLMPLNIGNKWIYQIYKINNNDSIAQTQTIEILSDTLLSGEYYFKSNEGVLYSNLTDGLYSLDLKSSITPNPHLIFAFPIDSLITFTSLGDTIQAISLVGKIKIAAGEFNCINYFKSKYSSNAGIGYTTETYSYYSPNIGLIKSEVFQFNSVDLEYKRIANFELMEYHLK